MPITITGGITLNGGGWTIVAPSAGGATKAIFGYGTAGPVSGGAQSITNLVSSTGVVATDTAASSRSSQPPSTRRGFSCA